MLIQRLYFMQIPCMLTSMESEYFLSDPPNIIKDVSFYILFNQV